MWIETIIVSLYDHKLRLGTVILNKIMFNKQLEKMNSLFNSAKVPSHLAFDSIALISTNVARPNTTTTLARTTPSRSTPKFSKQITLIKEQLDD